MNRRGDYRPIYSVMFDSPEYEDLSQDAASLLLAVKVSMGPAGIRILKNDALIRRSKLEIKERLDAARDELVRAEWIKVERQVWWLRNGLRFEPAMSLRNNNHRASIARFLLGLPKLRIVNRMAAYYDLALPFPGLDNDGIGRGSGWDRLPYGDHRDRDRDRRPRGYR